MINIYVAPFFEITQKCFVTHTRITRNCKYYTVSTEETFLQDFLLILKCLFQNYQDSLKNCFLCTTWTVMSSVGSSVSVTRCKRVKCLKESFDEMLSPGTVSRLYFDLKDSGVCLLHDGEIQKRMVHNLKYIFSVLHAQ